MSETGAGGRLDVVLSLISHTNVGKTTLARTLLRRDVGEVADRAHVTDVSEAHLVVETDHARLLLWDTPGFGDTARLMTRLRGQTRPVAWMLHQVWDRFADRALYCSQRAVRNIRDDADVVLYLVNAAEDPEAAGYPALEMELLDWLGRPVLLVLNQLGADAREAERRWRAFVESRPVVRGVLSLDAFTRCWVEETTLFRRTAELLEGQEREAMRWLIEAWSARQLELFEGACHEIAGYLLETARDGEAVSSEAGAGTLAKIGAALKMQAVDRRRMTRGLNERLDDRTGALMTRLIELHGLSGASAEPIERRIREFQVKGGLPLDEKSGALAGAVLSGALGGLAADAMTGGLSLGGGMIAGGILGALGGSAFGKAYRMIAGEQSSQVRWAPAFLEQLTMQALLRYLAIAHYGRGRGEYEAIEQPEHWRDAVREVVARRRGALIGHLTGDAPAERAIEQVADEVAASLRSILRSEYPHAFE